jgi:hypothetical protein
MTELSQNEKIEFAVLAIAFVVATVLAYRNREQIKAWFNDLTSKFTA